MLHVYHNAWWGRSPRIRQRDLALVVLNACKRWSLFIKYNKYICMSKAVNLPSCIRIYSRIYSSSPIYRRILSTLPWVLPELCFAWKWTKNTKHILSMWYCHKYNWVWYVFWNVVTVKFWAPPIVSWIVQAWQCGGYNIPNDFLTSIQTLVYLEIALDEKPNLI